MTMNSPRINFSFGRRSRMSVVGVLGIVFGVLLTGNAMAKKATTSSSPSAAKPGLTGLWLDHTKRGAVEIKVCDSSRKKRKASTKKRKPKVKLCGRIYWLKDPFDKHGKPLTDKLHPKKSRHKTKICGLKIIGNVKRISRRVYDKGWIYDPEKGKYFDVELTLKSNNILQVKGYKGIKLLSETFLWRRITSDLQPCLK